MTKQFVLLAVASMIFAACATKSDWPQWVLNPDDLGGLVESDCVQSSGNISLDRQHAATNARRNIAQRMKVGVTGLDESYAERQSTAQGTSARTSFQSRAEALIDTTLSDTKVTRVEEITNSRGSWVCAQVSMQSTQVERFVAQVVSSDTESASQPTEEVLLQHFRSRAARLVSQQ